MQQRGALITSNPLRLVSFLSQYMYKENRERCRGRSLLRVKSMSTLVNHWKCTFCWSLIGRLQGMTARKSVPEEQ
jgi:hypothetical protein